MIALRKKSAKLKMKMLI